MNKHFYRLIFNSARGMLMVVAEITRSGRLRTARRRSPAGGAEVQVRLSPLSQAMWLAAGLVSLPAQADIVADGHAPGNQQPTVLSTANGLPQVNIQTPNDQGVSRNQYTQFDVDTRGAILNNSHKNTATQQAGMVTGNPWLARQEAKIILNEVNSRNPSQLNGFIEVAGRRAEVVIANPSGITCAGCGFINASRSTLAAGQVLMENGQLKGFDVGGGRINIEGKGLNAGESDYTALIARAVVVNGKVHARELTVTTGANVTDAQGHVARIKPAADEGKPAFALDVAALGGMYANKITLVGTEKGLGVRNAGELGAVAGELTLSVDGRLDNSGQLQSQGNLQIASQGDMDNPGNLVAGKEVSLSATGTLRNEGLIRAGGNATLTAGRIESTAGSHLAAGVDARGGITQSGNLVLTSPGELKAQGQNLAQNLLAARGGRVDMSGSQSAAKMMVLTSTQGDVRTTGATLRAGSANIQAATGFNNDDGKLSAGTLSLQAQSIDNSRGLLRQENAQDLTLDSGVIRNNQGTLTNGGDTLIRADLVENRGGMLAGNGQNLSVTTAWLDNQQGTVALSGDGELSLRTDVLQGHQGTLQSAGKLSLTGHDLDLSAGHTQAQQLVVTADSLNNQNGLLLQRGDGDMTLTLRDSLNNHGGRTESGGNLTLSATGLDNTEGTLLAANRGNLNMNTTGAITNTQGNLLAGGAVHLTASQLDSQGGLISATGGDAVLSLNLSLNNSGGRIEAKNAVDTRSQSLNNAAGTMLGQRVSVDTRQGQLTNTNGRIVAEGSLQMASGALDNTGGRLQSGGDLHLDTHGQALTNTGTSSAGILSGGTLSLTTGDIDNTRGLMAAKGEMAVNSQGLNNAAGKLLADQALTLVTRAVNNAGGLVQSGARLFLDTQGEQLTNTDSGETGGLVARGNLQLNSGQLDGRQGVILGQNVRVDTHQQAFSHQGGQLMAREELRLDTGQLDNSAGRIQSGGDGQLDTHGQTLTNRENGKTGGILTGGALTLKTGDIDNQRGVVVSSDMARLTTTDLNNQQGQLTGHGGLDLTTHTLTNTAGRLQSDADLTINTQGYALDNADSGDRGGVVALKDLHLSSGHLNNQAGFIAAGGQADLTTTTLNNSHGQVAGNGGLSLHSQALDNADGKLQSAANVLIDTAGHTLDNQRGHIVGDGQTRIDSGTLDNQYGHLQGGTDLAVSSHQNALNNQHGTLLSAGSLTLNAGQLNNQSGELTSQVNGQLTLTKQLDNTQGQVRAGHTLNIDAGQIINRDTNTPGKGIEAGSLTMSTQTLDNTYGALRATVQLTSTVRQALENVAGLVSSGGVLTVRDDAQGQQLSINNREGTLIAGTEGQITAATLSGDGQVLSQGNLGLHLAHDFHNTRTVGANGNLTLETPAAIVNDGRITAGDTLTVTGQQVTNTAQAEISAQETHVNAQDTLTNTGLIDGSLTHLTAGTLTNTGTGRIYGDHMALQAGALNNLSSDDKAAVIAARERLDIGAGTVNNRDHALITSLGDLYIGGHLDGQYQAVGQGGVLDNHGATIEAGRDGSISMREVNNTNRHLVTEVVQTEKSQHHEAVLKGQTTRYDWDKVDTSKKNKYGVHTAVMPDGSRNDEFYEYQYTRTVMETQITDSDPGKILASGNLTLNGDRVVNHDSQIVAGGTLGGTVGELDNQATKGERVTTDAGWQKRWYAKKKKKKIGGTKTSQGRSTSDYRPSPVTETIDLKTLTWKGNTLPAGSGYRADGRQAARVDTAVASVSNIDAIGPGAPVSLTTLPGGTVTLTGLAEMKNRPLELPVGQQFALTLPSTLVDGQPVTPVIRVVAPNTRLPDNSLFTLHQSIDSHYLVETDPQFTRQKQWLGSDYMQNALLSDPARIHKRLGDGYYEQGLIRDQVTQLTGSRWLAGYGSDEEQYKGLMNNGIAFGKEYGLELGVALTPAQMALLTTDMVWLVNQTVTLPDGSTQTVQVPQVYAKVKDGDLTGDGALLGGKQVVLNTRGDITNSGSIIGREVTQLTAQILTNSGYIQGNRVDLSTRQDIYNTGGQLRGESSLSLLAGRDIVSQTTTRTDGTDRWLDRPAGMYVQAPNGTLTLSALNNITLSATELSNAGENGTTSVQAGNDLRLESVATRHSEHGDWGGGNTRDLTQQADVGTRITTPGAIALGAGRDILAQTADVTAGGALTAQAGRDIRLTTGNATTDLVEHSKQSSSGLLSKSSLETHDEVHDRQALGATLSGNSVDIRAKHDVRIEAGNVVGTQDVRVLAGNNLTVTTADETHQETHLRKETHTGLLSAGGMGFTVGAKKESWDDASQARSGKASLVGSLKGDTVLLAGQHYQQTGSTVSSPAGNVVIRGKSVAVEAGKNLNASQYAHTLEQKGFTLAVNVPVVQAVQGTAQTVQRVGKSNDDRVNMLAAANAAWDSARTANSLMNSAQGLMDNGPQGIAQNVSISLTYGEKKQEDTRNTNGTTAQASKINAGKHAVLIATGGEQSDITVTGSDIGGKQGTRLQADHDITLQAAGQEQHERTDNRSSGWNAGIAASYGQNGAAFGITAGANQGKGHGNGDDHTWRNSHIGDMNGQTQITNGGTATLSGAQIIGSGVGISADNLKIESLQDTMTYAGKQQDMSGQVTVGYGVSGSGSFSQSNVKSDYASVQEQSGIFAGKNGYQIDIRDHTDLTGGLITSSGSAEQSGFNQFSTGTLSWTDIRNHADYSGNSVGISGSASMNTDLGLGKNAAAQSDKVNVDESGNATPATGMASLNKTMSVGIGHDSGSDKSTTHSGINTGNIVITRPDAQEQAVEGLKTDITTETAAANDGRLKNNFDKDKVFKELNLQVAVTRDFSANANRQIGEYVDDKQAAARQALKEARDAGDAVKRQQALDDLYKLQYQRRFLQVLVGVVAGSPDTAITQQTLAIAATKMREETVKNSFLSPPIVDRTGRILSNVSGDSNGSYDGLKMGGSRMSLDIFCAENNTRCVTPKGHPEILESNRQGFFEYKGDLKHPTFAELLKDKSISAGLDGDTGGFQGAGGRVGPIDYKPGTFWGDIFDTTVEGFAGTHDFIGGQIPGFYDEMGNASRGRGQLTNIAAETWTVVAIPLATPFAVSEIVSPELLEFIFSAGK
ncbi:hemagglutinin repeat-containing protein [Cedecea neteri]|uniref:two-partner secretion domain-containing protein n=1 Tax=Cedecea neteri TaxID=158822 RepID=UPI002AA8FAC7|nr:hemagglutinin repeat-containing protein [Cedecea neteri]WPU21310.1 hemagglutinin repeat-containing protein [Cedecea neteri]